LKRNKHPIVERCAKCGDYDRKLHRCAGGLICDPCLEFSRKGRDTTTKVARALKIAAQEQATANLYRLWGDAAAAEDHEAGAIEYEIKAHELSQVNKAGVGLALGEAVSDRRLQVVDTLKAPDVAALDASAHRIELLGRMGNDCAALAIDAANSIQAENSLEKMLAHQLAVAHKTALEVTDKAFFEANTAEKARLLNLATRLMDTFQRGLLTLQRLRTGGEQKIIVQRVSVSEGGQAIVGNLRGGDRSKNE
jgi:hypothetical protein